MYGRMRCVPPSARDTSRQNTTCRLVLLLTTSDASGCNHRVFRRQKEIPFAFPFLERTNGIIQHLRVGTKHATRPGFNCLVLLRFSFVWFCSGSPLSGSTQVLLCVTCKYRTKSAGGRGRRGEVLCKGFGSKALRLRKNLGNIVMRSVFLTVVSVFLNVANRRSVKFCS